MRLNFASGSLFCFVYKLKLEKKKIWCRSKRRTKQFLKVETGNSTKIKSGTFSCK